jgi:hypothetical protein
MIADSPFKLQSLAEYPAVMTKEMVAKALGIAAHNIPPLSRAGLIKPLGRPDRYCVKHYSRDTLARNLADPSWLDKAMAAFHRHWRIKNSRKQAKQAGNQPAKEPPASESVSR